LGAHLIFDMAARSAEFDQALDCAGDIESRRPETGINIDDQGHITDISDAPNVSQYIIKRVNAQIGQAQRARSDPASRQINRAVTGALCQQGMVGIDGANDLQRLFFFERLAEAATGGMNSFLGHVRSSVSSRVPRNILSFSLLKAQTMPTFRWARSCGFYAQIRF